MATAECRPWIGPVDGDGYGRVRFCGRSERAHRVAWMTAYGPIPDGMCVLHTCDNPPCVRPDHLWLGTRADNNRDRAHKGRSATGDRSGPRRNRHLYRGDRHGKLTPEQVREIRARREAGETQVSLAERFNISRTNIRAVLTGKTWGWLP